MAFELDRSVAFDLEYSLGDVIDGCFEYQERIEKYSKKAAKLHQQRETRQEICENTTYPITPMGMNGMFQYVFEEQPIKSLMIAVCEWRMDRYQQESDALIANWEANHPNESIQKWETEHGRLG